MVLGSTQPLTEMSIRNPPGVNGGRPVHKSANIEYLHRDPASRRRRRKGSLKCETVKYGLKSQGTRTEKDCAGKGQ
jgi:hypothetical protein